LSYISSVRLRVLEFSEDIVESAIQLRVRLACALAEHLYVQLEIPQTAHAAEELPLKVITLGT
jgi:hypothetical protein